MRTLLAILIVLALASSAGAAGQKVTYLVDGAPYEGYYVSAGSKAPMVLLIHDWDGLTDYEVKRSNMLAEMGYTVFAADLFGAGVRPTKVEDRRQHTGELQKDRPKMRALVAGALEKAGSMGADTGNADRRGHDR